MTFGAAKYRRPVPASREFVRVASQPTRVWDASDRALADFADRLTEMWRAPGAPGTHRFYPEQAMALYEIHLYGGLFGPLQVSRGKTLISLMAPRMRPARHRPMLITLANLVDKTEAEARFWSQHFQIARNLTIRSYSILSRNRGRDILSTERPDLLVCDEAHKLKNPRAGVTKKIDWYLTHVAPSFGGADYVDLTGTAWTSSMREVHHRLRWALGPQRSPLPITQHELEEWCDVLDHRQDQDDLEPGQEGALAAFATEEDWARPVEYEDGTKRPPDARTALRRGFRRRFFSTPGVVGTQGENAIGASLQLRCLRLEPPAVVREALTQLEAEWTTPDGYAFKEATKKWSFARTLGLGFYHRRDPWPPADWLTARRRYASAVRYLVGSNRKGYDTPLDVENAVNLRGEYRDTIFTTSKGEAVQVGEAFDTWARIKPTFTYRTVPTWLSDYALLAIKAWADAGPPGVIWVEDVEIGVELARRFGFPLFASGGVEALTKTPIRDERGDRTIVASRQSNATGQNLQVFERFLISNLYPNASITEQQIARIHRSGTPFDIVRGDIFVGTEGHAAALEKIFSQARAAEASQGQRHKVLFADWVTEA